MSSVGRYVYIYTIHTHKTHTHHIDDKFYCQELAIDGHNFNFTLCIHNILFPIRYVSHYLFWKIATLLISHLSVLICARKCKRNFYYVRMINILTIIVKHKIVFNFFEKSHLYLPIVNFLIKWDIWTSIWNIVWIDF